MNCRDFQEIIDSYLSDELLTETNHDVLRHMEDCANCRNVIEARRAVRSHLKSAVINAPQYQISKNFAHNLQTRIRYEALENNQSKSIFRFGFGSWAAVAAGLVLVFTFGFILLNNFGGSNEPAMASGNIYNDIYATELPPNNLINVAFGDHQFCAIKYDKREPVKWAETPVKYENIELVAVPELKNVLADFKLKGSHTCEYKGTKFTHLVLKNGKEVVSVMMTDKKQAEKLGENIAYYSSKKYQMARFDVKDTAVFVVSDLNKQINSQAARALYNPLRKHLANDNTIQTALLMFY